MTTEKTFEINGLQPNSQHTIRVRALYRDGSYSEWSQVFKLKVKGDGTAPSQPSAPTIFVPDLSTQLGRENSAMGPQTVRFRHDSTKNGGGNLEGDVDYFEVYVNTTNSNTGGTQIGTVKATRPGSGAYSEANLSVNSPGESTSRWFYVIAVDMGGLRSIPSPTTQASSIPMIANAYISDLSADKITTGTLQAGEKITVGDTVAIALKANTTSPMAEFLSYSGTEPSVGAGYANNAVGFYMDSTGRFSLKNALTFDPAANNGAGKLTINADGAFSGSLTSEISLAAPIITGGSINIGPNVFQVNSSGVVIANNIQSAQIYGGSISIGGTQANPKFYVGSDGSLLMGGTNASPNFYVDPSGNLITRGSATIGGPTITGGSITAGLFRTTDATNVNRIIIDGGAEGDKDKIQFFNSSGGYFNMQINGPNLLISTNYDSSPGSFSSQPDIRIRTTLRIRPTYNTTLLEAYRISNTGTDNIGVFFSNFNSTENTVTRFLVNGNILNLLGGYGSISDIRLKENISISRGYLSDLMNIEVIKYNLIGTSEDSLLGFSAQQVEQVFPGMVDEDELGYLSVKTSIFIPMLVTAVQELNNRVQYLETELEKLNGN